MSDDTAVTIRDDCIEKVPWSTSAIANLELLETASPVTPSNHEISGRGNPVATQLDFMI